MIETLAKILKHKCLTIPILKIINGYRNNSMNDEYIKSLRLKPTKKRDDYKLQLKLYISKNYLLMVVLKNACVLVENLDESIANNDCYEARNGLKINNKKNPKILVFVVVGKN